MNININDLPAILTVDEMASVLRIGRNSAYELIRSRKIQSIMIGRCIRIPRSALEDFIRSTH